MKVRAFWQRQDDGTVFVRLGVFRALSDAGNIYEGVTRWRVNAADHEVIRAAMTGAEWIELAPESDTPLSGIGLFGAR